jgi:aldehyde:ferredoxin oxidoreductase
MKACMGKVLRVDLGARSFEEVPVPDESYRRYLGGLGLAAAILYDEIPAGADPLGPDNVLCFSSGLLTGTGSVMTGRWMVSCKSPLTGGWGDANCGGTFSPAIKQCGWDAILFRGVASGPVVFVADARGPRLEDASDLWGRDAIETEEVLLSRWPEGKKPAIAAIGQAAEKLSLISGISNDLGRYAARSGVGAVMGSKRLKALVLRGNRPISCADPAAVKALSKAYSDKVRKQNLPGLFKGRFLPLLGKALGMKQVIPMDGIMSAGILRRWGTIYNNLAGAVNGDSPMKNWGGSVADFGSRHYQRLDPDRFVSRETRKYHCYSCVIGCGGVLDVSGVIPGVKHSHKPEYETACSFGALCLNDDLETVLRCNEICNRSGLDTISAGATVAFAIECYENGLLTKEDSGGLELRWGNAKAIVALLELMARREGLGDLLADGTKAAAKRIGKGSERYAIHAGGQEPGMHDSRMDPMMGVAFSADPTPGRHTISASVYYNVSHVWDDVPWAPASTRIYPKSEEYEATEREADKSVAGACLKQVIDAAGGCLFALTTGVQHWRIFDYLDAATGEKRGAEAYMEAGRRIQTLRQLFNVKQGLDPRTTIMHRRMAGVPPLADGPLAGATVPIGDMVSNYWRRFGWDPDTGIPLPDTLEELGLPGVGGAICATLAAAKTEAS